ncbi:MAG: O-antigen ligase family protein [Limisphaerales bacterium]
MVINIVIICFVALAVQFFLRRDFDKGVAVAVFFLVLLPREVSIPLPGALPDLTGHRVVLLILLLSALPRMRSVNMAPVSSIVMLLCLEGSCRLLSTFTAVDAGASIKAVIDYWIETVMFVVIMLSVLKERRTIQFVAWSSLSALVIIAALGTIEKYTGTNLVAEVIPDMVKQSDGVSATFRHRILFGYAMAMGFPIALALRDTGERRWKRWLPTIGVLLLLAASYYSGSRGPWVGCALGGVVLAFTAGRSMRRKLTFLAVIGVLLLATRPGVYDTISSLWSQSFDENTVKGRSTDYRRLLWHIAYEELTKSVDHAVLGYGGHSTELLDVSAYFDVGAGGTTEGLGHTSWDSQLASDFMQFGFLGFGVELLLYLAIFKVFHRACRNVRDGPDREFMGACSAAAAIFFWAMTTVAIFNPQLYFLFWVFVAIAARFYSATANDEDNISDFSETDPIKPEFSTAALHAE